MLRVAISNGVFGDAAVESGRVVRDVALRPVRGEDELFLSDMADHVVPCARATALLARCIDEPNAESIARGLTVGDREALLLHLRRITLGEEFDCELQCPVADCGERMEFQLRVDELLVPPSADGRREHRIEHEEGGDRYEVAFRLPIAADLEHAAMFARDPRGGAQALLERCVGAAERDGAPIATRTLPAGVRAAISAAMAERDPQAEIELDLACPKCGAVTAFLFDTASFFLRELDQRAARVMREVHVLASHYHWGEREILGMPARRRARYLELVTDAAAGARVR